MAGSDKKSWGFYETPDWVAVMLHYKDRVGNRSWYSSSLECSAVKKRLAQSQIGYSVNCDEFPFFKTKEGGPRNHPGRVSLRYVNSVDNQLAGAIYGGLVTSARLRTERDKKFLVFASDEFPVSLGLPLNLWSR